MFMRAYKRLHPNQKADVDDADAVDEIVRDPTIGESKKGDLAGIFVYKFTCNGQLTLLAYEYDPGLDSCNWWVLMKISTGT
jgi:hypothetical protein